RGRSSRPDLHFAGRVLPSYGAGGRGAFAPAARARVDPLARSRARARCGIARRLSDLSLDDWCIAEDAYGGGAGSFGAAFRGRLQGSSGMTRILLAQPDR